MDNPEKLATLGTEDTRQRQTTHKTTTHYVLNNTMRKENTNDVNKDMSLRTTGGKNEQNMNVFMYIPFDVYQINVRENRRGNQQWTILRNWQHWVQKTPDEDKQNKILNLICAGQHYVQRKHK